MRLVVSKAIRRRMISRLCGRGATMELPVDERAVLTKRWGKHTGEARNGKDCRSSFDATKMHLPGVFWSAMNRCRASIRAGRVRFTPQRLRLSRGFRPCRAARRAAPGGGCLCRRAVSRARRTRALGFLKALFPRAYIDPNRHEHEIDREHAERAVAASGAGQREVRDGTGTVRRLIKGNVHIYDRPLSVDRDHGADRELSPALP